MGDDDHVEPKVFVSYSWSSDDHVAWVIRLAERLTADGVRVTIDRWDLREGQDKFAFMEQMVTDPEVDRVLVICDAEYAAKADSKTGGVGTESQIISPKVYGEVSQEKFLPLVVENNADGKPCVPTFLEGRIHFGTCQRQWDTLRD